MLNAYPPEWITLSTISVAVAFASAISLVAAVIFAAIESRFLGYGASFRRIFPPLLGYSLPIALIAYITGYLTAFSRTGAVGNLVPAVLALFGGLNIYVFGSDTKYKAVVAYCICLFAVMLFYGTQYGAFKRDADREFRFIELARQELRIRTMRKNLRLPDDPPDWIISSEPK